MFDIVAADEDEPAAGVDGEGVENAESRLAGAPDIGERQLAAGEPLEGYDDDRHEPKDDAKRDSYAQEKRQLAKQLIEHADFPSL
jgi:hypothetical protein